MNAAFVTALAGALLHFIWEGAALALFVSFAMALTRDPRIRYAVASAALFAMPLAFAVTTFAVYPGPGFVSTEFLPRTLSSSLGGAAQVFPAVSPLAALQLLMRRAVPFWFAGIAFFYLRSALGWISVRDLRRNASRPVAAQWRERLTRLQARLGIRAFVDLLESAAVDTPVVAGFLRPAILVPAGCFANLPVKQIELLLIHELAHVRRFDYLVNLIQKGIEGLLFYHPAVWWVSGIVRREREHCCDDVVLSVYPEAQQYARTLADLEITRWSSAPAATGGDLNGRIRRILGVSSASHTASAAAIGFLFAAACAFLMITSIPRPARAQSDNPYQRWVNEDVAYIISGQERTAFRNLRTDAERNRFIEQFWDIRNPTPGSAANPFKEEHYRRIAYSNQKFSSSTAGWKTDRGRIYIVYGPPDEIDSHPSCGPETPHEQWRYRLIEGIGQDVFIDFVDPMCKGEYVMTRDPSGSPGH
jgi:GWxTD domain-containing protein